MFIKPTKHVDKLAPYRVSESAKLTLKEKLSFLKLDWNEATFPPSPIVKKKVSEFIKTNAFNFYPDVTAEELRKKISKYVGLSASHIQVFNGSDSALRTICNTYLSHRDGVLIRRPTYTQIDTFIQSMGAKIINFTGENPFIKDLNKYHKYLLNQRVKLTYITNPNNPTGLFYSKSEIEQLIQRYPETLFVIDEAYFEYAQMTVVNLIKHYSNIIVTRTFSKAFGLAGLRMGYVISHPDILADINKVHNGKDINVIAQIAASAALDDIPYLKNNINKVIEAKKWLVKNLRNFGIKVKETPANFVLISVSNIPEVINRLKNERILVRDRSYLPQLDGYIRVSIGLREEMERFFDVFTKLPRNIL